MNLARARELGISRQLEPALRNVTHVATPRTRRRRSRRLTPEEGAQGAHGAASEPAAAASGAASDSSSEESDDAGDALGSAPPDGDDAIADGGAEDGDAAKPGVTCLRAESDAAGEEGAAADVQRNAAEEASCSAAAAAVNLPSLFGLTRIDPADWMGQLAAALWHLPLHKIRMPGTHDSGACRVGVQRPLASCPDELPLVRQARTRSASATWRHPSCLAGWCASTGAPGG
jgi:hypothetical protein